MGETIKASNIIPATAESSQAILESNSTHGRDDDKIVEYQI